MDAQAKLTLAKIAEMERHETVNTEVEGSIPLRYNFFAESILL